MTRMARLKQEAREAATLLGHQLGRFRQSQVTAGAAPPRQAAVAACDRCGALVVVDPDSPESEARLTGEGMERQCYYIEQEGHETA